MTADPPPPPSLFHRLFPYFPHFTPSKYPKIGFVSQKRIWAPLSPDEPCSVLASYPRRGSPPSGGEPSRTRRRCRTRQRIRVGGVCPLIRQYAGEGGCQRTAPTIPDPPHPVQTKYRVTILRPASLRLLFSNTSPDGRAFSIQTDTELAPLNETMTPALTNRRERSPRCLIGSGRWLQRSDSVQPGRPVD